MKHASVALAALAFVACAPSPAPSEMAVAERVRPVVPEPEPIIHKSPRAPAAGPRVAAADISSIRLEGVAFDSRSHRLVVVDQPAGPGSRFEDAAGAARSAGGFAALNAGFFTPEGEPLGMVISAGKSAGQWNSASSLGSGIWHEDGAGNPAISRRGSLSRGAAGQMRELIQAGPMLVENGRAVGGLDASKPSARSMILWDGGTRWWLGRASPCSLADLARTLQNGSPAGWRVGSALNFDGGRSADLWISGAIPGGPLASRPLWNKPVRNFLVLVRR